MLVLQYIVTSTDSHLSCFNPGSSLQQQNITNISPCWNNFARSDELYCLKIIETLFRLEVLLMTVSISASYSDKYPLIRPVCDQKINITFYFEILMIKVTWVHRKLILLALLVKLFLYILKWPAWQQAVSLSLDCYLLTYHNWIFCLSRRSWGGMKQWISKQCRSFLCSL